MRGHDKVEGRQASSEKQDILSENFRPITASLIPHLLPFYPFCLARFTAVLKKAHGIPQQQQ